MFKCKQCGRQFGANPPGQCPGCGTANRQPEAGGGRFWGLVLLGGGVELLLFAVLVGVVVALAIKYL